MQRDSQVASILSFVEDNRDSIESKRICAMILGEKDRQQIDDELMGELHARLPRAKEEVIHQCYNIIS